MMKMWFFPLLVLASVSCKKGGNAGSQAASPASHAEAGASTTLAATPDGGATEEGTNERVRALPRPPDKVHQKPASPYPEAEAIKDRPGFVTSPYGGGIVDVRDIPPGTLVVDPSAPSGSKAYFRVP